METCNCTPGNKKWQQVSKKSARTVSSFLLSILIAFFPKCPLCWAVYMSMFGSIGMAKLPYMPWLLPVLLGFLLFHVAMQYRTIKQKGPLPFCSSVIGATCLLLSRFVFPEIKLLLITGMLFIIAGSLLGTFAVRSLKFQQ
ncbi:hypothetical protein SAMN05428988_6100 [Chitinophaga sp. YR573]|uniref:hypothetical protein n=1 Tax=Chitinophaga sp. YR573 TaxID=1881040 RepID=UPI0008C7B51B|nr:hypothetical protein [Chitinophaga sp. YR573]SEW45701.1 hypothetical protein SAMN05428988_6100 [Chitinophaga sp. YR573]